MEISTKIAIGSFCGFVVFLVIMYFVLHDDKHLSAIQETVDVCEAPLKSYRERETSRTIVPLTNDEIVCQTHYCEHSGLRAFLWNWDTGEPYKVICQPRL